MKAMKRIVPLLLCAAFGTVLPAQDIHFSSAPDLAMNYYAEQYPHTIGLCVDSLRIDTNYTENFTTGELEMVVQRYPLARYEFYLDNAMYRRIDILQQIELDSAWVEDLNTGEQANVLLEGMIDIPNGAYHEFFPNGHIRIKGKLDGYNPDGTLKKTGEWMEWDANGNVIRKETYP